MRRELVVLSSSGLKRQWACFERQRSKLIPQHPCNCTPWASRAEVSSCVDLMVHWRREVIVIVLSCVLLPVLSSFVIGQGKAFIGCSSLPILHTLLMVPLTGCRPGSRKTGRRHAARESFQDLRKELVQELDKWRTQGLEISFWHIPRELDYVADRLAKAAFAGRAELVWRVLQRVAC